MQVYYAYVVHSIELTHNTCSNIKFIEASRAAHKRASFTFFKKIHSKYYTYLFLQWNYILFLEVALILNFKRSLRVRVFLVEEMFVFYFLYFLCLKAVLIVYDVSKLTKSFSCLKWKKYFAWFLQTPFSFLYFWNQCLLLLHCWTRPDKI